MLTITKFQSNPFFHSIDSSSSSHPPAFLSQEELKTLANKILLPKTICSNSFLLNHKSTSSAIFPQFRFSSVVPTICSTKASDSVGFHVRSAKQQCCIAENCFESKPRKTLSMKFIIWHLLRKLCRKFHVDCQTRTRLAEN